MNVADPSSSFIIDGRNNVYTLSDGNTTRYRMGFIACEALYILFYPGIPLKAGRLICRRQEAESIKSADPAMQDQC